MEIIFILSLLQDCGSFVLEVVRLKSDRNSCVKNKKES